MRALRGLVAVVLAASGAWAAAGCAAPISGPVVLLRLASPDPESSPTGRQIDHFVQEVSQRSGGTIRVDPVWDVTADKVPSWDQVVARGVAHGRWDMALVPTSAWDLLGVRSLRALDAPFLITSQPALRAVLQNDRLRAGLLGGLPAAGVTGLDMFPGELRHPFGYTRPLLGPDDYAGRTIQAQRSDTVYRTLVALGASPTDDQPDERRQGGQLVPYSAAGHIATGNVTFWPLTEALVVRTSVRTRLRPDQWALLRGSAARTRRWWLTHQPTDRRQEETFCAQSGSVVGATPEQLAALRRATRPVAAWLRRDPPTRRLMDRIRSTVRGVRAPDPPTSCAERSRAGVRDVELHALDGTYVYGVSRRRLIRAGVNPEVAGENSGRVVTVFNGGEWTQHQTARHFLLHPYLSGRYSYRSGRLTFLDDSGHAVLSVRVTVTPADGTLHFHDPRDSDPHFQSLDDVLYSVPWRRVGGVVE